MDARLTLKGWLCQSLGYIFKDCRLLHDFDKFYEQFILRKGEKPAKHSRESCVTLLLTGKAKNTGEYKDTQ